MPQISIIVPVYKAEAFLDRCVQSVLRQSFPDFELLLVNDGSPDRSGEMCEEYAKQDRRIRVFHKENGGQATARNLAIAWALENSDSRWFAFVDSDDWLHRDYLKVLTDAVRQWNVKVSVCGFRVVENVAEEEEPCHTTSVCLDAEDTLVQYYNECMAPWGKLYAKELFSELRFAQTRAYEDAFITHIPILKAGTVAVTEAKLYYYYENQDSTTRKKWTVRNLSQIRAHETRVNYCLEHGYRKAYRRELEAYVISCFTQATELSHAVKEDPSCRKYLTDLRPKLLPTLRLAKQHGLIPFNKEYLWIYDIAYPVKPVWVLRNFLEKTFGLDYPK